MIRKYLSIVIFTILIFLTAGCVSKFEKDQIIKQESVTEIITDKTSSHLTLLISSLLETFHTSSDVNSKNFNDIATTYPEVSALFLYNKDLELQRKFPASASSDDIIDNCLGYQQKKQITSIEKPFIGHSLHENVVYLCISIPFTAEDNTSTGILFVLVNSAELFSRIEQQHIVPYPYSLIVINDQQDVVYDSDPMRIGRDFISKFDSDGYDLALKNLYNMMTENKEDYFISNIEEQSKRIKKIFTWNTLPIYNETFYITLVRNMSRSTKKAPENTYLLSTLRSFAIQDTLIDPIVEGQHEDVLEILEYIYDQNPEVYSVQLADTSGIIQQGWPSCNSTIGYCSSFAMNKSFDTTLDQVLQMKQERIIHTTLIEGGKGKITFIPVLVHEAIYGVLIAIEPEGS